jgi:hypothetical protein
MNSTFLPSPPPRCEECGLAVRSLGIDRSSTNTRATGLPDWTMLLAVQAPFRPTVMTSVRVPAPALRLVSQERSTTSLKASWALCLLAWATAAAAAPAPVVAVTGGRVAGVRLEGVLAYKAFPTRHRPSVHCAGKTLVRSVPGAECGEPMPSRPPVRRAKHRSGCHRARTACI